MNITKQTAEVLTGREGSQATEVSDAVALGSTLSQPWIQARPLAGECVPYVVVPTGYEIQSLEYLFEKPMRSAGNVQLIDMDSFTRFVKEMSNDSTRIYGMPPREQNGGSILPPSFQAVFNDSVAGAPGWRDHTATYTCPMSPEWVRWAAANGKQMPQKDFAQFIEDNLVDVIEPAAADMLDLSRTLEAKKSANFASSTRLSNGETQFKYEEQIDGTARAGQLKIPDTFAIAIPALVGGERYRIECRFRYRIEGSALKLWYEMVRPHKVIEAVFGDLCQQIEDATTMRVLRGSK